MEQTQNRCKQYLEVLQKACYGEEYPLGEIRCKKVGYGERQTMLEDITMPGWELFQNGGRFGGSDIHVCFKTTLAVTKDMQGKSLWLQLATGAADVWNTDNPQFLLYLNDQIVCGMDMNHQEVCVTPCGQEGEVYAVGLYAYSNSRAETDYLRICCREKHRQVETLYYDFKVPFEAAMERKPDTLERMRVLELLNEVMNRLDLRYVGSPDFYQSVEEADEWLNTHFYEKLEKKSDVTVHSIGHTHIDVAWKWPVRQTREKVLRSFSTVLHLMEDYPSYRFMSSQPLLYQFVKEESPEVYEKIREKAAQGRWETEGAMWLEADCNLTSGESLVRQILYGKAFFAEEFGRGDNRVLWLPDVFGYSAAMPQIMKKSGIDYFMTTKIGWNEYNKFPNDVMLWQGIDGSEVLTYFITTTNHIANQERNPNQGHSTTYNGRQNVSQIMGTWQRFSNKNLTDEVLTCYGYGDGGGGPTAQMLEEDRRMSRGIPGCPVTKQTFAGDFFKRLENNLSGKKIPKWVGELYLEFHRGTYTSMARNKKLNRMCEFRNQDTEFLSVWAALRNNDFCYPKEALDHMWKLTLLNQFHDILPGSSIEEVYEVSLREYQEILAQGEQLRGQAVEALAGGTGKKSLVLFNTLSFKRDALVELPDGPVLVKDIPAKGYRVISDAVEFRSERTAFWYDGHTLSTPFYTVSFNAQGEIDSLIDLENNRELVKKGQVLNRLMAFEDRPYEYDAWNIDASYEEKEWNVDSLLEWRIAEQSGERFCIYLRRGFLQSVIEQKLCFYAHSRRIDFQTDIDWKEHQILLKAAFPVQIHTNKVVCDIQFGNVERPTHRNTSWDEARFEFCAHKWVDVAEAGYGAALLNNCKYGYDVQGSTMRITLLKSGIVPNPNADKEKHHFTYALLPHQGEFRTGHVIREAFDLNVPVYAHHLHTKDNLPMCDSLFEIDRENVIAETCKAAEDGTGFILRLYESFGMTSQVKVTLHGFDPAEVTACNLLEREESEQTWVLEQKTLSFVMKPYEIKTFRIKQNMQ